MMTELSRVDLVGVGLNATDTLIALTNYPARGSKVEYDSARVLPGGQVATAVVACQRWGMSTRYVGILGDDSPAALHREAFAAAGVEARLTTVSVGFNLPFASACFQNHPSVRVTQDSAGTSLPSGTFCPAFCSNAFTSE